VAHAHNGFWACMDTFKEMQELDELYGRGYAPWVVWQERVTRAANRDGAALAGYVIAS
jgi:hypothetical protein